MAEVAAEAEARGLTYALDHVIHHNPLVLLLATLREQGLLGEVQRFVFENDAGDSGQMPAARLKSSKRDVFSQENSLSERPKCP